MNSLTPIRSLSQNLLQIVDQDHLETEDFEDIKAHFDHYKQKIICSFFENYRKLAALPTNKKTNTNSFAFEDCLKMMSPFSIENIVIINEIEKHKIIDIDKIK
jgi:hypothetical protein